MKTCFFYLSQSVYIKLQSLGLQSEYHTYPEFALTMRMLPALAFVPPELVGWSFEQLVVAFPGNAYNLCRYFEGNYIGLQNLNGERNAPFIIIHNQCRTHVIIEYAGKTLVYGITGR